MFFQEPSNSQLLINFIRKSKGLEMPDEVTKYRLNRTIAIIEEIHESPEEWDNRCTFNIESVGRQFLQTMGNFNSSNTEKILRLYVIAYRFLCEFDFVDPDLRGISMELTGIKKAIEEDADNLDGEIKSQIVFASYMMPATILKRYINDKKIVAFGEFNEKKKQAESLKSKWDQELQEKENSVNNIKDRLEKYKTSFNFVGLYDGFSELKENKAKEGRSLFWSLVGMAILIGFILLSEILYFDSKIQAGEIINQSHFFLLVPFITFVAVLIYFFRIILLNYRSNKAQTMQIELRMTLCQFIQSYAEYSSEIKLKDKTALDKFENIIFSGILSDPEKLPSTFDGIEHISNLVKSMKGNN